MKISAIILLLHIPVLCMAQNFQGMSEQDMQKMMQQMQKVEACMKKVDQVKLKALEQRARKVDAEVKSLCANGKREQAQDRALSFSKEMVTDPTMQEMRKCAEMMQGTMPGMMPKMPYSDQDTVSADRHVCN